MKSYAERLHGRIAVSRPRATSSTASSRATTRSSPTASTSTASGARCRCPAGRTAPRTSCSSAGSSPARACSTCSRRTASCAARAPTAGCSSSAAGRRSARRGATSPPGASAASSSWVGSRRREGPAVPDRGRLRVAVDGSRVVRDRPARGDGRRCADRRLGHPRLQGRRAPRPGGAPGPAARAQGARRRARPAAQRPRARAGRCSGRPATCRGVQLAAGDREGGRLLRLRDPASRRGGALPPHFSAEIPPSPRAAGTTRPRRRGDGAAPPTRPRPSPGVFRRPGSPAGPDSPARAAPSAAASRQTSAEYATTAHATTRNTMQDREPRVLERDLRPAVDGVHPELERYR